MLTMSGKSSDLCPRNYRYCTMLKLSVFNSHECKQTNSVKFDFGLTGLLFCVIYVLLLLVA